jgi:hypothetical protein
MFNPSHRFLFNDSVFTSRKPIDFDHVFEDDEDYDDEYDPAGDPMFGGGPRWDRIKEGFKKFFGKAKSKAQDIWENLPEYMDDAKKILDTVKVVSDKIDDGKLKDTLEQITTFGDRAIEEGKKIRGDKVIRRDPELEAPTIEAPTIEETPIAETPKAEGQGLPPNQLAMIDHNANKIVKSSIRRAKFNRYRNRKKETKRQLRNIMNQEAANKRKDLKRRYKEKIKGSAILRTPEISRTSYDPSKLRVQNYQDPVLLRSMRNSINSIQNSNLTPKNQIFNLKNLKG